MQQSSTTSQWQPHPHLHGAACLDKALLHVLWLLTLLPPSRWAWSVAMAVPV